MIERNRTTGSVYPLLVTLLLAIATLIFGGCSLASKNSWASTSESTVSSPYEASELALRNYIYYLSKEQVLKPALVGISSDIEGFAKSGEQVWEVRIVNKEKGLMALYFVNPKTGAVHMVCSPGQWQKNQCVESRDFKK
jgi:hypothetical protein